MYLKALEIQGFKSFPDKTVLTFGEDITAIVGPNGSGKSNISDAIRWVMGEQSTRTLRGGKMEDVIFGGTAQRKQTGYAEVSLVLDNTTHLFDLEESEVMVTRRYYRSGESEYYINRRSVRLKDINELFMDTGLGREGYSIIGQGKIDEILSVKSSDRREVFEEAAGISRYRHRKEEAERKLERTDENLVRINDKIAELELQVEPLREQSERAKKFLVLRDELRGLEISVWLDTLERIRVNNIKLETDYKEAVRQKEEAERAVEERFAQAEKLSEQMRDKEVQADQLRFAIQSREATIRELESSVAVLKSSIQHNLENTARIREELEQREGRQDSLTGQIAERAARLNEIEKQLSDTRRRAEEQNQKAQEALRTAGTLAQELEALRGQEATKTADAHQAKALLSALAAAAQEVLDRDGAVRQELRGLEERLDFARTDLGEADKKLKQAREERDSVQNVISGYSLRLESRKKKAAQSRERHMRLQMDENALASRIKLLTEMEKDREGYSKAVKLVMGEAQRGNLKGIRGPVADLVKVPDQYALAIEIALGAGLQNIVVEACEFAETFLRLAPAVSIILNIDNDHLDCYGTMGNLKLAFRKFALMATHTVIVNADDENAIQVMNSIDRDVRTFAIQKHADYTAENVREYKPGFYECDVLEFGEPYAHIKLAAPGYHNVYNALAMVACVPLVGLCPADAEAAAAQFTGAGRRFEIKGEVNGATVVDDYAHHPTEVAATLKTARELTGGTLWAVHQPFTYSRTRALLDEFADALQLADRVVLTPIMGSREVDDGSVKAEDLAARIPGAVVVESLDAAARYIKDNAREGDLVITMGCGDVYKAADKMVAK